MATAEYQNLSGKIPEWRHDQGVWILELQLQQRIIESLHAAVKQETISSSFTTGPLGWTAFCDVFTLFYSHFSLTT